MKLACVVVIAALIFVTTPVNPQQLQSQPSKGRADTNQSGAPRN